MWLQHACVTLHNFCVLTLSLYLSPFEANCNIGNEVLYCCTICSRFLCGTTWSESSGKVTVLVHNFCVLTLSLCLSQFEANCNIGNEVLYTCTMCSRFLCGTTRRSESSEKVTVPCESLSLCRLSNEFLTIWRTHRMCKEAIYMHIIFLLCSHKMRKP